MVVRNGQTPGKRGSTKGNGFAVDHPTTERGDAGSTSTPATDNKSHFQGGLYPTIAVSDYFNAVGHASAAFISFSDDVSDCAWLGYALVAIAATIGVLRCNEKAWASQCCQDLFGKQRDQGSTTVSRNDRITRVTCWLKYLAHSTIPWRPQEAVRELQAIFFEDSNQVYQYGRESHRKPRSGQ